MNGTCMAAFGATMLLLPAATANAYTHHPSTRAERETTKELNTQQLQLAQQRNAGLSINADSAATDAAANLTNNSPPAAAPTTPVQQASSLAPASGMPPAPQ
jgi:hypothetical protein